MRRWLWVMLVLSGTAVGPTAAQEEPASERPASSDSGAPPAEDASDSGDAAATAAATQDEGDTQDGREVFRLEPLIVTARKREEDLASLPQSVSVVSSETIEDARLHGVRDASLFVPNLNIVEFSSRRLSFPYIRGIGSGQGDPAVVTYIDGVPQLTVSSTNLALLDVESIEFLRGPQSTLFGRNALGGVIHVKSRDPADAMEYEAEATYGNYQLQEYRLGFSTPLIEDQAWFGFSGLQTNRDGYTKNEFTGNDVDDRNSFSGRSQLLLRPDEQNEVRLSFHGEYSRDGGFVLSDLDALRDRPHRISQDFEGDVDRDILASSVTWDRYGDAVDFVSISAWSEWDIEETADFDFTSIDGVRRKTEEDQTFFSQELRLASAEDAPIQLSDEARLTWLAGMYGFYADTNPSAANEFRPDGAGIFFPPAFVGLDKASGDAEDWALAGFGQATLTLYDWVDFTGGLRYDYEDKHTSIRQTFDVPGVGRVVDDRETYDESYDEWVPMGSIGFHFRENVYGYGLIAKGFKAGGFNLQAPQDQVAFRPETSITYEVGVRTTWLDERLGVNVAAFEIDWDDMQLSQFDATTGGYIDNAGDATSMGFEVEMAARPYEGWDVMGSVGVADTEFDDYVDPYGEDVSDESLPFAPEVTGSVGLQYRRVLPNGWQAYARSDWSSIGTYYYDPGNRRSESYQLVNAATGVEGRYWRLSLWIRNVFDEEYFPVAFQADPTNPNYFIAESGAPRTYGVSATVRF